MGRKLFILLGVIASLAAATFLAPKLLQTVNGSQLHSIQSLTDTIWWPATLLRIAVYSVLSGIVYPAWIDGHRRAALGDLNALPATGRDSAADAVRARVESRLAALARARQRGPWVFSALMASELALAQLPYLWIRH
jgi:hypothetical protein